jgi:transcriptional regulator with XRE-family HTH domain
VQTVAKLFGTTLRRIRTERGLTQEQTAERTGISTNFVSELERGLKAPGLVVIVRLSKALNVSVHELLADFSESNLKSVKR